MEFPPMRSFADMMAENIAAAPSDAVADKLREIVEMRKATETPADET